MISIEEVSEDKTQETGDNLNINETPKITDTNEIKIINTNFDPNVEQFPVELDKSLKFSSKR